MEKWTKIAKDMISGGIADNKPTSKYRKSELRPGTKVEEEHTSNPSVAKEIAKDHLEEHPNYYTALSAMEEGLKEGKKPQKAGAGAAEEAEEAEGNPVSLEAVKSFFRNHQNPEDSEFHRWAESRGASPHAAEELAYQLAVQAVTGRPPTETVEGGKEASDRSYAKDFMAGIDPTGTRTFSYGMDDANVSSGESGMRKAVGTLGGTIGGATVVPGVIGGLTGGIKGFAGGTGGIRSRLAQAGKEAVSGATRPYRMIRSGLGAAQGLSYAHPTSKQLGHLKTVFHEGIPFADDLAGAAGKHMPNLNNEESLRKIIQVAREQKPEVLSKIQKELRNQVAAASGALGLSGVVGGGSAYMQYGRGREVGQQMHKESSAFSYGYSQARNTLGIR